MGKKSRNIRSEAPEYPISFAPKTQVQAELWHDLNHNSVMVVLGAAGTGKTFTCCTKGALWLAKNHIDRIILARANVPTGKSLGAIPGGIEEKLAPWLMPMTDVLRKAFGAAKYEYLVNKGKIATQPLETIRGRSFEKALILVDECQQLTLDEIKAITTRVGEDSILVLMGDPKQSDLRSGTGISTFLDMVEKYEPEGVGVTHFEMEDIVRSDTCAQMVKMFYHSGH